MPDRNETSPHVRHEADYMREANRAFARLDADRLMDPYDQHAARFQASLDLPIRSLDRKSVTLPTEVERFVGASEARELQAILDEVWELNERLVGEGQLEAFVQINGSPEQLELIERSLRWARAYVPRRLARPSTRDRGCPYRRFMRLWSELVHFVDQIGVTETKGGTTETATVIGQYLAPMCDFITWSFFQGTWMVDVTWSEDQGRPSIRERPDVDLETRLDCIQAFGVYRWKKARVFDHLLSGMADALAAARTPYAADGEELARIERLAEDIAEMRPLLVRNFPRSKAKIELPGGLVAHFGWDTLDHLGRLHIASSERALIEAEERGVADLVLSIGARGLLRCTVCSWRSVATYERHLRFPPTAIGRIVLEAVHEKLFSFYDRIDVAGILARWHARQPSPEPQTELLAPPSTSAEDDAAVIAASISTAAGVVGDGRRVGRVSSSLRLSALRAVLERHFGCEARSSKGSELVFYRPGGRHAFVARHVNNPLIPAIAIQRILKKLGISVAEWVGVVGER